MSTEQDFKIEQLEQIIKELKHNHSLEIKELEENNRELKGRLSLKNRIHEVVHAEHTMKYFPAAVLKILGLIDPSKRYSELYLKAYSFINYALVCGVGVIINMWVLLTISQFAPLWLSNLCAILIAWMNNWVFTVGPYGFIFGLSPHKKREIKK